MLVRLGAADSVPPGQRIARTRPPQQPAQRRPLLNPSRPATEPEPEPEQVYEAYVLQDEPENPRNNAQRACEAYRAAELIQPRPGLYIRVQA